MFERIRWKAICFTALAAGAGCAVSGCSSSADGDASADQTPEIGAETDLEARGLNEPPAADFEVTADLPENGDPVVFDASGTVDPDGDELTYAWRFGDQSPGGGEQISHIYAEGGDFEVTLTVSDAHGATDSLTKTVSIKDTPFARGDTTVTILARDLGYHDEPGVEISPVGTDITKTTDEDGEATFEGMPTGQPIVFEATKEGFAKQVARINLPDGSKTAPIQMRMQEIGKVVTVDSIEAGAEVDGYDGARLQFPANAVVDADGEPVSGEITIEFTNFDVSAEPSIDAFPGAFMGVQTDGSVEQILSFGSMEVNLKKDGEPLQVKPGKRVEMDIPVYTDGMPMKADIPLWSLDESTGIWVEEGSLTPVQNEASPTDRVLRTEVTHFTTWNGDYPLTTPCKMKPKCMIVDRQTGKADTPLKSDETCNVKVTSGSLPGLGNTCHTPEARVEGKSCQSSSDCFYWEQYQDCTAGGTCTTKRRKVQPSGISCNTQNPPGGQQVSNGVCESGASGGQPACPGLQYCSGNASSGSTQGQCALPSTGGVFAGATGQFNQQFVVGPKGDYVSGPSNPEASNGWIWVPNTDLSLKGVARKGTLHGGTNVSGHDSANKAFKDGTAVMCKESRPIIPMRHECGNGSSGLSGNCPEVKRRHFCDLLFSCPNSEYSRTFTQVLGLPNVKECKEKLENDYNVAQLKSSLSDSRINYNGNKAANCLDDVAALRKEVNQKLQSGKTDIQACQEFDSLAFELNACTGVEGQVDPGNGCVHDLECKDKNGFNHSCIREKGQSSCFGVCQKDVNENRTCGDSTKTCDRLEYCVENANDPNKGPKCMALKSQGATCKDPDACKPGLYCGPNDTCQPLNFNNQKGQACMSENVCRIGLNCNLDYQNSSSGVTKCQDFSKPGEPCFGESGSGINGCVWNAYCHNETCAKKKGHQASCSADYECLSGVCQGGKCFGPSAAQSCP